MVVVAKTLQQCSRIKSRAENASSCDVYAYVLALGKPLNCITFHKIKFSFSTAHLSRTISVVLITQDIVLY